MTVLNILFYIFLAGVSAAVFLGWIRHEEILETRRAQLLEILTEEEIMGLGWYGEAPLHDFHASSPAFFDLPGTHTGIVSGIQLQFEGLPDREFSYPDSSAEYEEDLPVRESIA